MSMGDPHTQPQPQDFYIIKTGPPFLDHICVARFEVFLSPSPLWSKEAVCREIFGLFNFLKIIWFLEMYWSLKKSTPR